VVTKKLEITSPVEDPIEPVARIVPTIQSTEQNTVQNNTAPAQTGLVRAPNEKQAPVASQTAASQCQAKISSLVSNKKINFETGRANVKSNSLGLLNQIASAMKNCRDAGLLIHGYTDSSGDANANRRLSHSRAKAVGLYLLNNGVTQKIRVFGHGANDPIADNNTDAGRAQNRRIEFEVVPTAKIPN
jgi:outer membrane protein OmpA-like peptidoglycan-associated protein